MSAVPPTTRAKPAPRWSVARGLPVGVDVQGVAAGVDGGAAGEQGHGLGGPAVVGQRGQSQVGEAGQDDVAVGAACDPARAAGADQVVRADDAGAGPPMSLATLAVVLAATIVSFSVAVPADVQAAAGVGGVAADRAAGEGRSCLSLSRPPPCGGGVAADRAVGQRSPCRSRCPARRRRCRRSCR